jgi:hypothetical protein
MKGLSFPSAKARMVMGFDSLVAPANLYKISNNII